MAFNGFRFAQRRGRFGVGQGKRARLHFSKRLLDQLLHLGRLHIAKDKNDAVFRDDVAITKFEQLALCQLLHRLGRPI